MKRHYASIGLALVIFALLSAVAVIVFRGLSEQNRLLAANNGEHTFSALFASLRDHENFGTAVESIPDLGKRVIGVGVYGSSGETVYVWGTKPRDTGTRQEFLRSRNGMERRYIENPANKSLVFIFASDRNGPPPPPRDHDHEHQSDGHSFFFDTLRTADTICVEVREDNFWNRKRFYDILFPLTELILAGLIIYVRVIMVRNTEYRERIEQQKNLVVLGTAASTLAHEIKNPLMAIRLQTSIIERGFPEETKREIAIINGEVERLSMLSHHVTDYLRDPAGHPYRMAPEELAREAGMHLFNRDLVTRDQHDEAGHGRGEVREAFVMMDPERFRSVLENLLQNAFESGGDPAEVSVLVGRADSWVTVDVLDRGRGIPRENQSRIFDPFFTTKSTGSGIGLAICKRFVHAAGGTISLEPREGGGTRAHIELPEAAA